MDDIVAAQCHRQRRTVQWQARTALARTFAIASHAPRLVELGSAAIARIGCVIECRQHSAARMFRNAFRPQDKVSAPHFEPQPVGKRAQQARIDLRGQIVGHPRRRGFECPGQRSLELALRNRGFKLGARDAQPGAATRRSRARIGQHVTIRRNRKTNQLVPLAVASGQDALALRRFPAGARALSCRRQRLIVRSPHRRPPGLHPRMRLRAWPVLHLRTSARGQP